MTVDALADMDVVLRLCVFGRSDGPAGPEFIEDDEDMAEAKVPRLLELANPRPLRNGGASYVTPNSGC